MSIDLVTKFLQLVDEKFATESKKQLVTNQDFTFDGAKTVKVYKVSTTSMNDYDRDGTGENPSRYGPLASLDATTETFTLRKDRSFTFAIDRLDADETGLTLQAGTALERQIREVVIPEVDGYVFGQMCSNAGIKPAAKVLTADNIYDEIVAGNNAMDNYEVPEEGRSLIVTPDTYLLMKKCKDIVMETNIGNDMRIRGVIANLDGCNVIRVPASRLPEGFGFMIVHSCATVAPTKLEDYKIHEDPPGISGSLVEGRVVYDAFVLDNKAKAIYYQAAGAQGATGATGATGA